MSMKIIISYFCELKNWDNFCLSVSVIFLQNNGRPLACKAKLGKVWPVLNYDRSYQLFINFYGKFRFTYSEIFINNYSAVMPYHGDTRLCLEKGCSGYFLGSKIWASLFSLGQSLYRYFLVPEIQYYFFGSQIWGKVGQLGSTQV